MFLLTEKYYVKNLSTEAKWNYELSNHKWEANKSKRRAAKTTSENEII